MKTIKPVKKLDCLTALKVFKQVPINTTGHDMSKDGILYGRFFLRANPRDERFDSRYTLTIRPWTPYLFDLKDGSKDLRVTIEDFQPYPGTMGGFAGSLLVSGKRPRGLNLIFNNHIDGRKAWAYLAKDYISGLIEAGYSHIPSQNHTIAEIFAERDTGKYSEDGKQRLMDKEKILVVSPSKIEVRQGDVFGVPLVSDKIYKSIQDLIR